MRVIFFYDFKCVLGIHQNKDHHLIYVEDEMPVAVAAEDNAARKIHVLESFTS